MKNLLFVFVVYYIIETIKFQRQKTKKSSKNLEKKKFNHIKFEIKFEYSNFRIYKLDTKKKNNNNVALKIL